MNGRSRLLILIGVLGLVLTIAVGTAGASRKVSGELQKRVAASHVILGGIGRPPLVGGPYGDPGDYPGAGDSTTQSSDSSSDGNSTRASDDDDCLLQITRPRSAC
jgi:hypothetical protein